MSIAEIIAQTEQESISTLIPQVGIGGTFLLIFARFLGRIEVIFATRMDRIDHGQRGLSKAIWVLLAEVSTAGSFVREEAKRMIERDKRREESEAEELRKNKR